MFQSKRAVAVPFHFVNPFVAFWQFGHRCRFHRADKAWRGDLRLARFVSERRLSLGRGRLETRRSSVSAICSIVRPLNAETPSRFAEIVCAFLLVLRKIHFVLPLSLAVRSSVHSPFNFLPLKNTESRPFQ